MASKPTIVTKLLYAKENANDYKAVGINALIRPLQMELQTAQMLIIETRRHRLRQLFAADEAVYIEELNEIGLRIWND